MTKPPATFDVKSLLRPELAELKSYVPAVGSFEVRLDANEAPSMLSPAARARLGEVAASVAWERYPDATIGPLREAIATRWGDEGASLVVPRAIRFLSSTKTTR